MQRWILIRNPLGKKLLRGQLWNVQIVVCFVACKRAHFWCTWPRKLSIAADAPSTRQARDGRGSSDAPLPNVRDAVGFACFKVSETLSEFTFQRPAPLPLEKKKNVVNGSSLPLTEPTWADLTGLPVSFVWQSSMKRAQKLWGRKKKKEKKRGGGGLQKCSTLTPLKHVFLKLGCHLFLNYPLILSSVVSFSRVCRRLGCPVFS